MAALLVAPMPSKLHQDFNAATLGYMTNLVFQAPRKLACNMKRSSKPTVDK